MRSRANAKVNFQRRHFEFLARIIANAPITQMDRKAWAAYWAYNLKTTNPHFDADKFIQWANGDERYRAEREQRKADRKAIREGKAWLKAYRQAQRDDLKYYNAISK